jgi:hypothetical protein
MTEHRATAYYIESLYPARSGWKVARMVLTEDGKREELAEIFSRNDEYTMAAELCGLLNKGF